MKSEGAAGSTQSVSLGKCNGKTMGLWKKNKNLTPDQVAAILLMFSHDLLLDAREDLSKHLGVQKRSELDKVTEELMFFCFFALDYWLSDHIDAKNERQKIREALSYHWLQMLSCDDEG